RIALVEYGQRRLEVRRLEVGEERAELGAGEQRLIDDGARRQGADEERLEFWSAVGHSGVDRLAREVEGALPGGGVAAAVGGRTDEHLTDRGAGGARAGAQHVEAHRYLAPSQHAQPVAPEDVLDDGGDTRQRRGLARQEEHADGERFARRER